MTIRYQIHRVFRKLAALTAERGSQPAVATLPSGFSMDALAPYVKHMALSGEGTDACLALGCLPVPVHFYSPIPDIGDLAKRDVWRKISKMAGLEMDAEKQVAFLLELGRAYGLECAWPRQQTEDRNAYYIENGSFNFSCAAALHVMIRHYKPKRIIEIGSGNSSRVISAAIDANHHEQPDRETEYTIVDPYPDKAFLDGLPHLTRVVKERVELLDPTFFQTLEENDILFIDSGHSVKIGGDVNYLILDVLPTLQPGVVIHFHDIPMPYEYPEVYATNPSFRMFWTEGYLLQAFLAFNDSFETLMGLNFVMNYNLEAFIQAFPAFDRHKDETGAGSYWLRRKPARGE